MRSIFWSAGAISGPVAHLPYLQVICFVPLILAFYSSTSISCSQIHLDTAAARSADWGVLFIATYFASVYIKADVGIGIIAAGATVWFVTSLIIHKRRDAAHTNSQTEIDIEADRKGAQMVQHVSVEPKSPRKRKLAAPTIEKDPVEVVVQPLSCFL